MTRIKYKHDAATNRLITPHMVGHNDMLYAILDPTTLTYEIFGVSNNNVVRSGSAVSLNMLKKITKRELKNLGVNFKDEVRSSSSITIGDML